MTSRTPEILGDTEAGTGAEPESFQIATRAVSEERREQSEAFDSLVAEIRSLYGSETDLLSRWVDIIRRRLGVEKASPTSALLAFMMHSGIRLLVALLATALLGEWAAVPWGRWATIVLMFGLTEAVWAYMSPPQEASSRPGLERIIEDWTALLPTVSSESDLRELAELFRRWTRPATTMATGLAVAATMVSAGALVAPNALRALPVGSMVLLSWVLYDFGATVVHWGNLFNRAFMAREARFEHRLFWPSPADSPEIEKVMRKTTNQAFIAGWWITVFLVMSVVLVGWDSALVPPLALGFVAIGYLTTLAMALSNRASVRKIIERSRQQRLTVLRHRIDGYESRFAELSAHEAEDLRNLLFLHDRIRDAPAAPPHSRTLLNTAAALVPPTVMFVITVFGEVSAERFLDAILP